MLPVPFNRAFREGKAVGNRPVGHIVGCQFQNIEFALAEFEFQMTGMMSRVLEFEDIAGQGFFLQNGANLPGIMLLFLIRNFRVDIDLFQHPSQRFTGIRESTDKSSFKSRLQGMAAVFAGGDVVAP